MSELDNEKQAKLTIQASSAPAAKKKTKPAGVKKVKKGARLAGPNKLDKEATIAAWHGDNDKTEKGAIEDDMDPSRPVQILEKFDLEKMQSCRRPYYSGNIDSAKEVTEMTDGAGEKAVRKKRPRGWDPDYTRRMFFPYWRSVLVAKYRVKVYPHYAPEVPMSKVDFGELLSPRRGSKANGSSRKPNANLSCLGRLQ
ncbi:hypothetical protein EJB05_43630 [Eragrostis curvula]|uniref:Uncharacterized protein n=1 Tax=Eragrostis curvula TaxID=38414 RepID=A0A5J9THG3_9POAL|nr:hypothetical protein EJB05_43630 [Eragrostis curvula]